jgi:O-antigen/teichoic acid export membrane protein
MQKSKTITGQIVTYLQASMTTQFISILLGVLTRRLLGPAQMGVWSVLQIIMTYAKYTSLGTMFASLREIPFYVGKGDHRKADEIRDIVFSFCVVSALPVSAGVLAYAFWCRASLSEEIFYGLILVSGLILLKRLSNVFINFLRCYKHFDIASSQMVWSSVVNAALIGGLCYFYKIYGYIVAMMLSFVFNIVYVLSFRRMSFRWKMDFKRTVPLMLTGLPLMVLTMANTLFLTADKIMIGKFMGLHELGLYSVAIMAASNIANIPNSIGIVLMPNFQEKFGKNERKEDLRGYLEKSSYFFCDAMPYIIGGVWFLGPIGIEWVLPQFSNGIPAMKYLALSSFFLSVDYPYGLFLVAIKKHLSMAKRVALACMAAILLNIVVIRMGWGLEGIAIATTAAVFLKFSSNYFLVERHLYGKRAAGAGYFKIVFKFSAMLAAIILIEYSFKDFTTSIWKALAQLGVLFIVYIPALVKLNSEFKVWELLKQKIGFGRVKVTDQG